LALNSIAGSLKRIQGQVAELQTRAAAGDLKTRLTALTEKLQAFSVAAAAAPVGGATATARLNLATTTGRVKTLFDLIEDVDLAPTPQVAAAVTSIVKDSRALQDDWKTLKTQDIAALNQQLRAAGLPVVEDR